MKKLVQNYIVCHKKIDRDIFLTLNKSKKANFERHINAIELDLLFYRDFTILTIFCKFFIGVGPNLFVETSEILNFR